MAEIKYKVSIMTLGCRVNQYESDSFASSLSEYGISIVPFGEKCDASIVNTCTVTAESDRKSRQMIRRAAKNADRVIVTGCYAQISSDNAAEFDGVVFVGGNGNKSDIPQIVYKILSGIYKGEKIAVTPPVDHQTAKMTLKTPMRCRSYIKIEDGCNNRCSYCVISTARGPVRSKPSDDVISEAKALSALGCREVILTGIETASYGLDFPVKKPYGYYLADLISSFDQVEGIERVGLGSVDPTVFSDYFCSAASSSKKLLPHFHLSIQSGSSSILAAMKRRYTADSALSAVKKIKKAIPDATFSADIIVGFPGETEEDFKQTVDFCRKIEFLHLHIFPYSKRNGTYAAQMNTQIPENIKHERLLLLEEDGKKIKRNILEKYVSAHSVSPVRVLIEKNNNGTANGHSEHFVEINISNCSLSPGMILSCTLSSTDGEICFATN